MSTIRHKVNLELISYLAIAAAISVFYVAYKNNFRPQFDLYSVIPQITTNVVPTPTPIPKTAVVSQLSSDGAKKLTMKVLTNKDYTQTYTFFTSDASGNNQKFIYKKTTQATNSMGIPFNAWSPDDRYFFIVEHTPTGNMPLAFNTSGTPFSQTDSFFDIADTFNQRETGYVFDDATGWASETLIILNTKTKDDTKGPSYWFEIPSKAVIQLSTEF